MRRPTLGIHSALQVIALGIWAGPAFAYVDPNTTGVLYQLIFPLIVAVTAGWRWIQSKAIRFWKAIRKAFGHDEAG